MHTQSGNTVNFQNESKQKFIAGLENNFLVLPDGKTVVGSDASDEKRIMMEDIETNQVSCIGEHRSQIYTLLYDQKTRSLLVGDYSGHVIQYQKNKDSNFFTKVKDYGDLGIGFVQSSCLFGDLGIFGGYNKSSIAVICISEQKLVKGKIETAFKNVDSLQVCEVSESKVLLSVGGRNPSYYGNKTDVYEIMIEPSQKHKKVEVEAEKVKEKESDYAQKKKVETQSAATNTPNRSLSLLPPPSLPQFHLQLQSMPHQMIETLISSIQTYVDGLFKEFAKVVASQLHTQKSNSTISQILILRTPRENYKYPFPRTHPENSKCTPPVRIPTPA